MKPTCLLLLVATCFVATPIVAQELSEQRVRQLEVRVDELDRKLEDAAGPGVALILFGAFCALWAQNTNRNPWLWFFLGFLLSVITVFVLLYKNAKINKSP